MYTVEQLYQRCIEMLEKYGSKGGIKSLKVEGIGELILFTGELTVRFYKKEKHSFNITQPGSGLYPADLSWLNLMPDLLDRMEDRIKEVEEFIKKPIYSSLAK